MDKNSFDAVTCSYGRILAPTLEQLISAQFPERRHLLFPWLREQESCMIYAETGVGKSLFSLSVAISVAGGGEFLGWKADHSRPEQGWKVLYVDGEMHIGDIQERARMLLDAIPGINREQALRNLRLLSRQHQDPGTKFPLITKEDGMKFIGERVKSGKLDLVVLDNFSTLGEVEDENAASSFNAIQQFLLELKTQDVATILVHHAGKGGDFRGSSKLAATFETIIKLEAMKEKMDFGQAQFRARWQKVRGGGPSKRVREVVAALVDDPRKAGSQRWLYEESALDRLDDMKDRLLNSEFTTRTEMAAFYSFSPTTITNYIDNGINLGLWTDQQVRQWFANGKRDRKAGRTQAPVKPMSDWRDDPEDAADGAPFEF